MKCENREGCFTSRKYTYILEYRIYAPWSVRIERGVLPLRFRALSHSSTIEKRQKIKKPIHRTIFANCPRPLLLA